MDLEIAQTTTTAKLPILKQGEYDMWRLRIEQYFQVQDYALWDVIENGNSFKPAAQTTTNADGTSTTLIPGPVTTEEKVQKKNDVKARSMLLMALPNEHLMTFNQYKDAKTLFAAIQTRFGGNEATKKTQKTLLKQMYENFSAPRTESLGGFKGRNCKLHVSLSSQNMAFVSSPSSTNEVNTAYGVSTANTQVSPTSTQVSTASTQVSTANLSDETVYAFLSNQPNRSQLVYEDLEQIHEDDIEEIDLKWQLALLSMGTRRGSRNQDNRTGIKIALEELIEFNKSEFNLATYKRGLASVEEQLVFYKRNEVIFYEQLAVLKRDISYKDSELSMLKSELEKLKQEKESNQLKIENFDNASKSHRPQNNRDCSILKKESLDASLVEEFVLDDKLEKKTVFPTVDKMEFVRPKQQEKPVRKLVKLCNYHQRERVVSGNNYTRVNYNYSAKKAHPSAHRNMVPRAVLMKTGLRLLNTARPVNTAHPNTIVYSARPMPKAVNTARPNSAVVNVVRANQGHPQKEYQGYVDSGCLRHMTRNMSYLSDFKEFDGGYVTFRGGAKREKITGKGTLKTGKLDFEDV
ncbi:hypothetical protein Tco_1359732 [Tanacetum coccineum]